jgi:hypothetical protein
LKKNYIRERELGQYQVRIDPKYFNRMVLHVRREKK